ncbi:MAG: YgeY family selenium metabolism-linked hydrolase [Candidatus Hydrogenedentota bacterium]
MVKSIPASKIAMLADKYRNDMVTFMRDLIRIPGESTKEEEVIKRTEEEMKKCIFDDVFIDPMGNVIGRIGSGKTIIAIDAHMDTVGVGDRSSWQWDPYEGKVENDIIFGRGAADQRCAMVGMVYGGRIIKELELIDDYTLYIVGSVQEEDCDGLPWLYIVKEDKIIPECVMITDSTNMNIYRGQRGRMEIRVTVQGRSCHGSAPERGINAIYKMVPIIEGIEKLNKKLKKDKFLEKGTITVTQIFFQGPSQCAVPDSCTIHIDRRLTLGETKESAIAEIKSLKGAGDATVEVPVYRQPSWRGVVYEMEKYYPTWVLPKDHIAVKSATKAFKKVLKRKPVIGKWTFSTNGVAVMGILGIPCVGFGPADEIYAHSVLDQVPIQHLVDSAKVYAAWPLAYLKEKSQHRIES